MKTRKKLGIIFGGKSAEYEVSIISAKSIFKVLDPLKYEVVPIAIDLSGFWYQVPVERMADESLSSSNFCNGLTGLDFFRAVYELCSDLDVVFPVMHGPFGEDGSIQGFFEIAGIPYVGAGVLGSAVGMDKDIMKRLLRDAGLPIADFLTVRRGMDISYEDIQTRLGSEFFIKPANMGSSLGISLVNKKSDFLGAMEKAFLYDHKVVVEKRLYIREIECSVLGFDDPIVSLPGELIPKGDLYSYHGKYKDPEGAVFILPAKLSDSLTRKVQQMTLEAFKVLCADSMARVDLFLDNEDHLYINEINTIPGFTSMSLYPKLWEFSGISYPLLIEHLIDIAIKRNRKNNSFQLECTGFDVSIGSL
jgi:D-alanine-D-alanine ligase